MVVQLIVVEIFILDQQMCFGRPPESLELHTGNYECLKLETENSVEPQIHQFNLWGMWLKTLVAIQDILFVGLTDIAITLLTSLKNTMFYHKCIAENPLLDPTIQPKAPFNTEFRGGASYTVTRTPEQEHRTETEMSFSSGASDTSVWISLCVDIICCQLCQLFENSSHPLHKQHFFFFLIFSQLRCHNQLPEVRMLVRHSQIAAATLTAYIPAPTAILSHLCPSQLPPLATAPSL